MSNEKDYTAKLIQIARRYYGNNTLIDWEDVQQAVEITLIKAKNIYSAARKCKFTTFLYPYVKTTIQRNINKQLKDIDHDDDSIIQLMAAKSDNLDEKLDTQKLISILDKKIDSLQAALISKQILKLFIRGYSPLEMSNQLSVSKSKIHSTVVEYRPILQEICNIYNGGYLDV